MVNFIAHTIEKYAKKSTAQGQAKYRAYFVNTHIYESIQPDVDAILIADGYEDVIVSE